MYYFNACIVISQYNMTKILLYIIIFITLISRLLPFLSFNYAIKMFTPIFYFACEISLFHHVYRWEISLCTFFKRWDDLDWPFIFFQIFWVCSYQNFFLRAYLIDSITFLGDEPGSQKRDSVAIQIPRQILSRRCCRGINSRYHLASFLSSGMSECNIFISNCVL